MMVDSELKLRGFELLTKAMGLVEAERILCRTKGIAIVRLTKNDVVRHPLVQSIVDAYETDVRDRPSDRSKGEHS